MHQLLGLLGGSCVAFLVLPDRLLDFYVWSPGFSAQAHYPQGEGPSNLPTFSGTPKTPALPYL